MCTISETKDLSQLVVIVYVLVFKLLLRLLTLLCIFCRLLLLRLLLLLPGRLGLRAARGLAATVEVKADPSIGAKDCTPEINTSEIIVEFQRHFPMDFQLHFPTEFHFSVLASLAAQCCAVAL